MAIKKQKRTAVFSLWTTEETAFQIAEIAKQKNISKNEFINKCLEFSLTEMKKK